jgi:hypothetical protein
VKYKKTNLKPLPDSKLEVPMSILTRPHIGESTNQRKSLPIGYFNRTGPSEESSIWRIEPCTSSQGIEIGFLDTLTTQIMAQMQKTGLTVCLLQKIAKFERYSGIARTPEAVFIIFHVKYNDESYGYVYGGPMIYGKASSELNLLELHNKIGAAKALLGDEEWHNLQRKYGIERDSHLILRRDMNLA